MPARRARREGLGLADCCHRAGAAGSERPFLQGLAGIKRTFAESMCRVSQNHYTVRGWLAQRAVFHKFSHTRVENSNGIRRPKMVNCMGSHIGEGLCEESAY